MIWAIEFGLKHPDAHVFSIDLSPIQPDYAPPSVAFEICDAKDEWIFRQPFDFIHTYGGGAARLAGWDWGIATRYAQMLSELDFVNMTARREAIALSLWVKGERNKRINPLLQHDILNMVEPICMALFMRTGLGGEQGVGFSEAC
ncbi:hypothetical protein HD806DRAFT_531551 [Xylariaceae sp. AK1471]|nr:hypothetical protein HD806DRAFT_531551 [Xylariaceae sp. AK1471]